MCIHFLHRVFLASCTSFARARDFSIQVEILSTKTIFAWRTLQLVWFCIFASFAFAGIFLFFHERTCMYMAGMNARARIFAPFLRARALAPCAHLLYTECTERQYLHAVASFCSCISFHLFDDSITYIYQVHLSDGISRLSFVFLFLLLIYARGMKEATCHDDWLLCSPLLPSTFFLL